MHAWFLNLGPPSKVSIKEANSDIRAILATEPDLFLGCEGVGKGRLPNDDKYGVIRDLSTEGRANIFAYAKGGIPAFEWKDMKLKFPKKPGTPGMHAARSFVRFNYKGAQIVVAHNQPDWFGTGPSRLEHEARLVHNLAPWTDLEQWKQRKIDVREESRARARMLFWDRNMQMPEAREFAERVDGWVVGEEIDCAITRHVTVINKGYTRKVNGHTVHTDHPWGAFHLQFRLD